MNNDQYLCLRRNVIAFLIAFMLIGGFLALLGILGYANVIETRISGQGTMDQALYTKNDNLNERVLSEGNYTYKSSRTWDETDLNDQKFITEYTITAGTGGYQNQYAIQDRAADYGHEWRATKITGNFSTTSNIVMTETTLDSLIVMDGENATFRGKILTVGEKGRPVTEYESTIVGKAAIEQYLNISKPIEKPEDWLALCGIIDEVLPDTLSVTPVNMTMGNNTIPVGGKVAE